MAECSLIISYYNRTDYLKLVFAALERQSFKDFEVIIADDGSSENNVAEIEKLSPGLPFGLLHHWHEDKGFRKNIILNKAVVSAGSEYLVFIDGDCIPHTEFIKEHLINREKRTCLTGRRVNLSAKITSGITPRKVRDGFPERSLPALFADSIWGGTKDPEKGIYFKNEFLRRVFNTKSRGILGCNFSLYKQDLLDINGFDERYLAPSIGEDSDIQYRLELNGVKIKSLNNIAVQYHLFHEMQQRPAENLDLFELVKKEGKAYTKWGIEQAQATGK